MEWKDVGNAVRKTLPLLGTALGGPVGGAVGGLVSLIAGALGLGDEEATPDKVMEILQADPEAMLKLRELELNHKIELEKLILDHERLRLGDVANARTREVLISQATGKRDINLYVLAWLVVVLFFGLVATLIWAKLPEANVGPVNQLFGAMAAGFGMVLQYFFGSSKGSAEKTAMLAKNGNS